MGRGRPRRADSQPRQPRIGLRDVPQQRVYTMVGDNGTTPDDMRPAWPIWTASRTVFLRPANLYRVTLDAVTGNCSATWPSTTPWTRTCRRPTSPTTGPTTSSTASLTVQRRHRHSTHLHRPGNRVGGSRGRRSDDDASFGSGNCDIDALGNRYFMFAGGKLKAGTLAQVRKP